MFCLDIFTYWAARSYWKQLFSHSYTIYISNLNCACKYELVHNYYITDYLPNATLMFKIYYIKIYFEPQNCAVGRRRKYLGVKHLIVTCRDSDVESSWTRSLQLSTTCTHVFYRVTENRFVFFFIILIDSDRFGSFPVCCMYVVC